MRPGDVVEARIFHVHDAAATQADEVVMLMELGVEARRRSRVAGLAHQAEGHERAQDAVDRHAGDLGQFATDDAAKLLGRRVIGAVQDCFKDGAALSGDRQAGLAMGGEETVGALLSFCRVHVSEMSICTR